MHLFPFHQDNAARMDSVNGQNQSDCIPAFTAVLFFFFLKKDTSSHWLSQQTARISVWLKINGEKLKKMVRDKTPSCKNELSAHIWENSYLIDEIDCF